MLVEVDERINSRNAESRMRLTVTMTTGRDCLVSHVCVREICGRDRVIFLRKSHYGYCQQKQRQQREF